MSTPAVARAASRDALFASLFSGMAREMVSDPTIKATMLQARRLPSDGSPSSRLAILLTSKLIRDPAQLDDVETAYHWLLEQGYAAHDIASVGHSIGGYLAVSLALRLRDRGAELPGAILSISPWCDPTLSGESVDTNAERDKLLSRGLLELFRSCWLDGPGVKWTDPQVNLLRADLSGLPLIAVFYGQDELLASEASEFGRRAERAGNDDCAQG